MKSIQNIKLTPESTIKQALLTIDNGALQIALIVDDKDTLLGTITDGDIRRGLLQGLNLNDSIKSIIHKNPTVGIIGDSKEIILQKALAKNLRQIPIIDENRKLIGIQRIEDLIRPQTKTNRVILMVGGLGTRLRPLTESTPKPMLKVGNKPILQTIVEKFAEYGFNRSTMCVNYKYEIIKNYFGDGSDFGVKIDYILEETQMGTAGALGLLEEKPDEPFFVMNGDLLTNINFEHLRNHHLEHNATATMCVREYDFQVPYGVVNVNDINIVSIKEKPLHKFFVSAGIYMLSPDVFDTIPKKQFFDMPTLFEKLILAEKKVVSFPLREYWLDIGRMEEYEKANSEYGEVF